MTALEDRVAAHYDTGAILDRIKAGLVQKGANPEAPDVDDLKLVDEFHTAGIEATEMLLAPLGLTPETRVLDIGSGIGGPARYVAKTFGCSVTGVDLTPAFVSVAKVLSKMTGLDGKTTFVEGSATALPVGDASIDLAMLFHVGMNIPDKPALFAEVHRVLAPGGRFLVYDIMRGNDGPMAFPVPWASTGESSFVAWPADYRAAGEAAGLTMVREVDHEAYGVAYFKKVTAAVEADGPPPVGLHLIMGDAAKERYGNAITLNTAGTTRPYEMIFKKG